MLTGSLVSLSLNGNQLSSLPSDLPECQALEGLHLQYNNLSSIPEELHQLMVRALTRLRGASDPQPHILSHTGLHNVQTTKLKLIHDDVNCGISHSALRY